MANSTVCDAPLEIDEILERDGEAMERPNAVAGADGLVAASAASRASSYVAPMRAQGRTAGASNVIPAARHIR